MFFNYRHVHLSALRRATGRKLIFQKLKAVGLVNFFNKYAGQRGGLLFIFPTFQCV